MIYLLEGAIENYAWGGYTYINQLLNRPQDGQKQPVAELWLGDHINAPAQLLDDEQCYPLNTWLSHHRQALSQHSLARFGQKLPYLLKILDVRLPLSIQVHPNKQQAELGYQKEQAANIPLQATHRIYKDDNHKPEMMIALSDFWLLHGFAPMEKIQENLAIHEGLAELRHLFKTQPIAQVYSQIMKAEQAQLSRWLLPILDAGQCKDLNHPVYWIQYTQQAMAIDIQHLDAGLMCFLLFNLVHMKKGEALVQLAQLPHAYLRGQNIELMAASDNVLRAGLTPKYVVLDELLTIIDSTPVTPNIFKGKPTAQGLSYPSGVDDFTLEIIKLHAGEKWQITLEEASIFLCLEQQAQFNCGDKQLTVSQGQAIFAEAGTTVTASSNTETTLVWASSASEIAIET